MEFVQLAGSEVGPGVGMGPRLGDDIQGQAARGNRKGFVQSMTDAASKTRKDLEQLVGRKVRQVVAKVNLATREDLTRLEKRLGQSLRRKSRRA